MSKKAVIDKKWDWILSHEEPVVRRTAELAAGYPCLRRLYPFASHQNLWFSRATEYPYGWNLPHVRYEYGKFHAVGHDKSILFVGDLEEVVARVASAMSEILPDDGEGRSE